MAVVEEPVVEGESGVGGGGAVMMMMMMMG